MSERRTGKSGGVEGGTKHSTQYARRKTFHVLCFTFCALLSLSQVYAQTSEPAEEQLESDLPDEVIAEIIDTTRIVLEPRSRFSDPLVPQLIHAIALYPKERLWNLPPSTTPQKAVKPTAPPPKNYMLNLSAYPSLPESLIYKVFFAGRTERTHGFLHLNRQQLGNVRTKERGNYNLDGIRGGLSHQYQQLSEISLDLGLNLKALEWLPATEGNPNLQKDLRLFRSDLNWQQQISETTWSTLNLDTTLLRIDHDGSGLRDEAADLRLNFDMALSWPFLNPIHAGGNVEYFSAGDTEEIIARLYARDEFSPFGPFVLSIGLEGVSFRESDDTGEYKADSQLNMEDTTQQSDAETGEGEADPHVNMAEPPQGADIGTGEDKADSQSNIMGTSEEQTEAETGEDKLNLPLYPSLALTTHLDKHWLIRIEGSRTIARHQLSTLYFDTDYISLNPLLRPEKAWNAQTTLKYHRGAKFEVNISGFARQIDDLVVFTALKEHLEKIGVESAEEFAGIPTNIDASIYGGQLLISARIVDRLDLRFRYTHEVAMPTMGEQIPYRAADRIDMDVVYQLPSEFHVALKAELQGPRYVNMITDETLQGYLLLQPKLSKTVGGYIDIFVASAFAIGEYRLLERYELSQSNFDFGIELKF